MLKEIKHVFSREFQENAKHLEFRRLICPHVKFKNESEGIDKKIDCLIRAGYESNCHIEVGDLNEA